MSASVTILAVGPSMYEFSPPKPMGQLPRDSNVMKPSDHPFLSFLRHRLCGATRLNDAMFLFATAIRGDCWVSALPALFPDFVMAMSSQVIDCRSDFIGLCH